MVADVGTEVGGAAEVEEVVALLHPMLRLLVVADGDEAGLISLFLLRRLTRRNHDTR